MRLRRFTERDARTALRRVKQTLGPEAVILATRAVPEGIEITAAVDVDEVTAAVAPQAAVEPGELGAVLRELREHVARVTRLGQLLGPLPGSAATLGAEARALAERLLAQGVAPPLARQVAERFERARAAGTAPDAALAEGLAERLVATGRAPVARVRAFVGPSGGGKTTTIAKLAAAGATGRRARPGLVMADTYRIGAAEQLGAYARLLGVPMVVVRDSTELGRALASLADRDPVYVDTAGLGGDPAHVADVRRLLAGAGAEVTVTAVLPAVASEAALRAAWRQLAAVAPASCVVTKVDEGAGIGAAWSWAAEAGVPVDWLGTGQRVPEDLAAASGPTLARWFLAA